MAYRKKLAAIALPALAAITTVVAATRADAESAALKKGWNNIAYTGASMNAAEALAPIEGKYAAVYRWDSAGQRFDVYSPAAPEFANSMQALENGDSVWIDLQSETASLEAAPKANVLSIPASAFLPGSDLALYDKKFNQLSPVGNDDASRRYFAPLTLPQGATVTSLKAAFEAPAAGPGQVQVRFDYTALGNADSESGQVYKLAEVLSTAGPSPQTAQAFAHAVDNSTNVYFLVVDLTGGPTTKLKGVSIAYTAP